MKKIIFFLFVIISFTACNENMPIIDCLTCPPPGPPGPGSQKKNILIEEFTGVRCIGCPAGSTEIENLLSTYGDRVIAVSIHTTGLAEPYPESQFDFRTEDGADLISYLGLPAALPSAVFGRKMYAGESGLQFVSVASWGGRVSEQIPDTLALVSLTLDRTYDPATRSLSVVVNGEAQEFIDEEVRLTLMISESNIVDAQLTPQSSPDRDLNYVHKHMLRDIITAYDGDVLLPLMTIGEDFEKRYTYTLPENWVSSNCEIIAFTHLSENSKEILQVVSAHLVE